MEQEAYSQAAKKKSPMMALSMLGIFLWVLGIGRLPR
jgi:hypothetical protein